MLLPRTIPHEQCTQKEVILVTQSVSPMTLSAALLVTQRSPTCHSERSDESENGEKINTEKYPLLPDPKMHHFVLHDNAALYSVLCTLYSAFTRIRHLAQKTCRVVLIRNLAWRVILRP